MIGYLKGKVICRGLNYVVVDTGSIGYRVYVPKRLLAAKSIELYTYQHVREDINALFGFSKKDELEIFELLLTVPGVGPRMALVIVSELSRDKIIQSIVKNDPSLFKTIPGVGSKVAAKIIVELKSKVSSGGLDSFVLPEEDETIDALMTLGYKRNEIIPLLKELPANLRSVQEKVRYILRHVGKRA